jgi:DNA invertase Pin-like site-specific DNA recombinase
MIDVAAARAQRMKATKEAQKKRGEYRGGVPPFGFTYDGDRRKLVPIPSQQKALRRIQKLHGEGMPSRTISADLAKRGIKLSHVTITKIIAGGEAEAAPAKLQPAALPRRRTRPTGNAPFGWRRDETGEFVVVPEQQMAIRRMRRMKERGLSLRKIAAAMKASGMSISHVGVKIVLKAASGSSAVKLIENGYIYVDPTVRRIR